MRKTHPRIFGVGWSVIVLFFLASMFAASFFITAYLYKILHLAPPDLLVQIINSVLGLVLSGLLIGGVSSIAKWKGWVPERNVFAPILDALEKISKGNFSIRLENSSQDNQMVSVLTNSVNKVALELEQMESMRQEFVANVSHEIQSPLTSIRGFAQALQDDTLSLEDRHHYLSIIETESTRLSRITEDLLKLAALESEHVRFDRKPYRLDKQIRSLILACEPQWTSKALEMNISLEDVEITADEDLLSQVWVNLIHNSIKFTPQGRAVCIDLHQKADKIEFKIQDTGIGIPPENQARVFERFYKADPSRNRINGGSGLGLAIAKKIVEMHQGEIWVESSPAVGTTFTVRLDTSV